MYMELPGVSVTKYPGKRVYEGINSQSNASNVDRDARALVACLPGETLNPRPVQEADRAVDL